MYSLHPGVIATELGRHIQERMGIFGSLFVTRGVDVNKFLRLSLFFTPISLSCVVPGDGSGCPTGNGGKLGNS